MYFRLVLKSVLSPVKIPLSCACNKDTRPFHLPSYLPITDKAGGIEAFCHKKVNSEFGMWSAGQKQLIPLNAFFSVEMAFENRI